MGKRNKIRYQSTPKEKKLITLSGQVFLQYADDEAIEKAEKGDLMLYPYNEALHTTRQGDYGSTGFSGYFKVDVSDGKQWCLVQTGALFPHNEHHFAKSERPIDTYALCAEIVRGFAGRALVRIYREHYELEEND